LYIPLGGNRVSARRVYVNLLIVFALCGLWHGAQWTFLVWGLFHGTFLILERVGTRGRLSHTPALLRHVYTLLVVMTGWVLFRAATISEALVYLRAAAGLNGAGLGLEQVSVHLDRVLVLAIVAGVVGSTPWLPRYRELLDAGWWGRLPNRQIASAGLALQEFGGVLVLMTIFGACVISLSAQTYNPFIYFRF
jgi:alginate O-acetyltransferase complex protein AlgI